MTCIRCRICQEVVIKDVFMIEDEEYSKLIKEHQDKHTVEEAFASLFYMSEYK